MGWLKKIGKKIGKWTGKQFSNPFEVPDVPTATDLPEAPVASDFDAARREMLRRLRAGAGGGVGAMATIATSGRGVTERTSVLRPQGTGF